MFERTLLHMRVRTVAFLARAAIKSWKSRSFLPRKASQLCRAVEISCGQWITKASGTTQKVKPLSRRSCIHWILFLPYPTKRSSKGGAPSLRTTRYGS